MIWFTLTNVYMVPLSIGTILKGFGRFGHQRGPGSRDQEWLNGRRKGGSSHKQADPVTRACGARADGISSHEREDLVIKASSQHKECKVCRRVGTTVDLATSKWIRSPELAMTE
jgi:hypothetical protein